MRVTPVNPLVRAHSYRKKKMEIGSAGSSVSALAAQSTAQSTNNLQDSVGLAVVKKAMDNQQMVADKLLQMLQPKGQVIDIRV